MGNIHWLYPALHLHVPPDMSNLENSQKIYDSFKSSNPAIAGSMWKKCSTLSAIMGADIPIPHQPGPALPRYVNVVAMFKPRDYAYVGMQVLAKWLQDTPNPFLIFERDTASTPRNFTLCTDDSSDSSLGYSVYKALLTLSVANRRTLLTPMSRPR